MQFTKVRLTGFKSFVDPTELDIMPGMTGIVGPNGCGKSNIVESLKWVMGETSAKQMRGTEMDDVIFAGTANRPARNIAEVVLTLDNSDRTAPAAFNEAEVLEISRRIEREKGSHYRVNGNDVRARDVHLLFADQASGARSTALVSQGQISKIISAKPTERRMLIEEAAGIVGLHSRRHEAELRLKAAEANLERLNDVLVTLEAQLQSLRKQARQAARYRNLNDHIRKAEAAMFTLLWDNATAELTRAEEQLAEIENIVTEFTGSAAHAATEQANAQIALPPLREDEARAAAALQRMLIAQEQLEEERARIESARLESERRLQQIGEDLQRESALVADADTALERLSSEEIELGAAAGSEEAQMATARAKLYAAREDTDTIEARLAAMTQRLAAEDAQRADLDRRRNELRARVERLRASAADVDRQIEDIQARAVDPTILAETEERLQSSDRNVEMAREAVQEAEAKRGETAARVEETGARARSTGQDATRLDAEIKALARLLEAGDPELWPSLIDAVKVEPGFEKALGAALGDDLDASTDEAAPLHWQRLDSPYEQPNLPSGADSLLGHVTAPDAMKRRLSQIGVVPDAETGRRLAGQLHNGQRLVTKDGALWRWDGFVTAAEAPTSAAIRLEQRNRLAELRTQVDALAEAAHEAEAADQAARNAMREAAAAEQGARQELQRLEREYNQARDALAELRQKGAENDSRLAARRETAERIAADVTEAATAYEDAEATRAAMPDPEPGRIEQEELRGKVNGQRGYLVETQSAFEGLTRQLADRRRRLTAIAAEKGSWSERRDGSLQRQEQLSERQIETEAELAAISDKPAEIDRRNAELLERIEVASTERQACADKLAEAERFATDADKALREAEHRLAAARETRVRGESAVEQSKQNEAALTDRIRDRLQSAPATLRELAGLDEGDALPDLESAERRVERLHRERETMGPVNLRAEAEAQELTDQMESLSNEKGDLTQAIDKLRRGISELNREGRERLLIAFKAVDEQFQKLFVQLFGGGRAYLTLTEAEDPLDAGVEIMASPPGKKLQVLSLLSGGEQALTALALLFAVFMSNPAPICVLDEVDAPLDESNVDRFCSLVSEMAHSLSTRFLVITHHRMTMARADRLFGVTMGERGVSQLVSVDLGQAMEIRATA